MPGFSVSTAGPVGSSTGGCLTLTGLLQVCQLAGSEILGQLGDIPFPLGVDPADHDALHADWAW